LYFLQGNIAFNHNGSRITDLIDIIQYRLIGKALTFIVIETFTFYRF